MDRSPFTMWRNTRMVVLSAMTAAIYAAILIPFKVAPVIPGVTEFRPANAVPVVCSFLFGPAAGWGAAFGNMIGDFFGGLGPGDAFGFIGNFLYGTIPYRVWRALRGGDPMPTAPVDWIRLVLAIGLGSGACAVVVGWGLGMLGFVPFYILANIVFVNNFAVAMTLGPLLLFALYPRVRAARLLWSDILPAPAPPYWRTTVGMILLTVGVLGGALAGNLITTGRLTVPGFELVTAGTGGMALGFGVLPFVLLIVLALILL